MVDRVQRHLSIAGPRYRIFKQSHIRHPQADGLWTQEEQSRLLDPPNRTYPIAHTRRLWRNHQFTPIYQLYSRQRRLHVTHQIPLIPI